MSGRASSAGLAVLHVAISLGIAGCASTARVQFPLERQSGTADIMMSAGRPCRDSAITHGNAAITGELSVQGRSVRGGISTRPRLSVAMGCPIFVGGSFIEYALGPDTVRMVLDASVPRELFFARDATVPEGWRMLSVGRSVPGQTWHWRADYGRMVVAPFRNFRIRSQEWNGILGRALDVRFVWRGIQIGSTLDRQLFVPEAASQRPTFAK